MTLKTETCDPVRSLSAHHYTNPAMFRAEMQGLFARSWQFAFHLSELEYPGDFICFEIAGERLFAVRGRDGKTRAFYNVCQHRAHQLVKGKGHTRRLIVCPYHSWTYELTGQLRSGPNLSSVPGLDRKSIRLAEVRLEEFAGFAFVNLDDDAESMDRLFPGVREEVEAFVPQCGALKPVEWIRIPERCNWKVSVENYSECYHCLRNHPTFSSGVIRPETYDIQPQGYCLRHTTKCQNLERMTYEIDLGKPHAKEYSSWFLWPLFSFQVYPGNVLNTYHWRPIDVGHVEVWRGWYTVDGKDDPVITQLARQDRETTVEEDIRLVESVQLGLGSRGYKPGPLVIDPDCGVNSEHSIKVLHDWMRDSVEENRSEMVRQLTNRPWT